jgi:3-methyladenine DNA glycosylase AlkD
MDSEFLKQLAEQLKGDKDPACRRAINRILADATKKVEAGEYDTPMAAEADFRRLVEENPTCKKKTRAAEAD